MKDTKYFRLLSALSVYELKRFRKYLCSPLHNEDKTYIELFDIVSPYISDSEKPLTREIIAKKLFPKKEKVILEAVQR